MSGTAKTVLIVAGVGVGVFVLLKVLSPSPLVNSKRTTTINAGTLQGLIGLGTAIGGLFGSSSSSASSPQAAPYSYLPGGAYSSTSGIVGNELADHADYGPVFQG